MSIALRLFSVCSGVILGVLGLCLFVTLVYADANAGTYVVDGDNRSWSVEFRSDGSVAIINSMQGNLLFVLEHISILGTQLTSQRVEKVTQDSRGGKTTVTVDYYADNGLSGAMGFQSKWSFHSRGVDVSLRALGLSEPENLRADLVWEFGPEFANEKSRVVIGDWSKVGNVPIEQYAASIFSEVADGIRVSYVPRKDYYIDDSPQDLYLEHDGDMHEAEFSIYVTEESISPKLVIDLFLERPLGLAVYTDKVSNLFEDIKEPVVINATTTNFEDNTQNVSLEYRVIDFGGKVLLDSKDSKALQGGETWHKVITMQSPDVGPLYVEVTAFSANGDAEKYEFLTTGVLPRFQYHWEEDSVFGMAAFAPIPDEHAALDLLKRIGVRWLRSSVSGISALELRDTYGIYANHMGFAGFAKGGALERLITDSLSAAKYSLYLEMGNEWNMLGEGIMHGTLAKFYVENVLVPACELRQEMKLDTRLFTQALAGPDTVFLTKLYEAGGWDKFDALSLHPGAYPRSPDYVGSSDEYWTYLGAIRKIKNFSSTFGEKEIWLTEVYAPTQPNSAGTLNEHSQAEDVVLTYALGIAEGMRNIMWYQFNDGVWYDWQGINNEDVEYHFGLMTRTGMPKAGLFAYATAAYVLDNAKFLRELSFRDKNIKGLLFDTSHGEVAVIWSRLEGYRTSGTSFLAPWEDPWKRCSKLELRTIDDQVKLIDPVGRSSSAYPNKRGMVTIDVTGCPVYVLGASF